MRVKINKKLASIRWTARTAGRHTQTGAATVSVTAPVYRIISTSKLALATYWRKRP